LTRSEAKDRGSGQFCVSDTIASLAAVAVEDQPMTLSGIVDKYLAVAGGYGRTTALSALGLSAAEVEQTFDQLDEDYHISRYIHLSKAAGATFQINGFPQTHVSIDPEIQSLL
jgi:hypothetical protein